MNRTNHDTARTTLDAQADVQTDEQSLDELNASELLGEDFDASHLPTFSLN